MELIIPRSLFFFSFGWAKIASYLSSKTMLLFSIKSFFSLKIKLLSLPFCSTVIKYTSNDSKYDSAAEHLKTKSSVCYLLFYPL